ncbi:hypothetical protein HU200_006924 [Digitaria exilis]|uniref:Disease resistance R13L4/SHOC-2-like LRR domain-containing protein n=1 Tax=Digitaria exilis TaxID=1010633 RepID=A0A835KRF7_9POAL|nr:hypothetical protein HU200_006924 [Digitaria exilis]
MARPLVRLLLLLSACMFISNLITAEDDEAALLAFKAAAPRWFHPSIAGNLSSLMSLELSVNQLEGSIPASLGVLKDLRYLGLAINNLSGEPPVSLYNLSSLGTLQIQSNLLNGSIPTDIGKRFPSMQLLALDVNQFTGPIPPSVSNLTSLQALRFGLNSFSGYVPRTLGRLRAMQYLDLARNTLEADDREGWEFITSFSNCSQLRRLDITGNNAFTGHLPSSMVNLSTTLQLLGFGATGIKHPLRHRQSGGP